MKKGIALLAAVGLIAGMTTPVLAEEQITTYKGDQEIVLTEAGDVDLTLEELIEKTEAAMNGTEDMALIMKMDIDASMSMEVEGESMSMDLAMKGDMSDNKKDGLEYKSENMTMAFFGMEMTENSEEYIFSNAGGKQVSVKKEVSSEGEEETSGEWVAEIVEETEDTEEETGDTGMESFVSDDLYSSFTLLDKKYTDGEKEYYVLQGNMDEVMGSAFGDLEAMVGEIDADAVCYMLVNEEYLLESLHMDLGEMNGIVDEDSGAEMSFSSFLISMYTEEPTEVTIPEEVQAAGDAVA